MLLLTLQSISLKFSLSLSLQTINVAHVLNHFCYFRKILLKLYQYTGWRNKNGATILLQIF